MKDLRNLIFPAMSNMVIYKIVYMHNTCENLE